MPCQSTLNRRVMGCRTLLAFVPYYLLCISCCSLHVNYAVSSAVIIQDTWCDCQPYTSYCVLFWNAAWATRDFHSMSRRICSPAVWFALWMYTQLETVMEMAVLLTLIQQAEVLLKSIGTAGKERLDHLVAATSSAGVSQADLQGPHPGGAGAQDVKWAGPVECQIMLSHRHVCLQLACHGSRGHSENDIFEAGRVLASSFSRVLSAACSLACKAVLHGQLVGTCAQFFCYCNEDKNWRTWSYCGLDIHECLKSESITCCSKTSPAIPLTAAAAGAIALAVLYKTGNLKSIQVSNTSSEAIWTAHTTSGLFLLCQNSFIGLEKCIPYWSSWPSQRCIWMTIRLYRSSCNPQACQ